MTVSHDVTAWRLVKTRYAATAFDGEGARLYGGRWNSLGVRVAYASETTALAILEVLVHLQASRVLSSYSLASVTFPAALVRELEDDRLPPNWTESPPPADMQAVGDEWVQRGESAVLRVSSVIVHAEYNFLLNPAHPEFARASVGPVRPFAFDPRLLPVS